MDDEKLVDQIEAINNQDEMTLHDTIKFMDSDNYKARFVAEYMQLKIRINGLRKMLIKNKAGTLEFTPTCDISILEDQLYDMTNYLENLEVRAEIEKIELPKI